MEKISRLCLTNLDFVQSYAPMHKFCACSSFKAELQLENKLGGAAGEMKCKAGVELGLWLSLEKKYPVALQNKKYDATIFPLKHFIDCSVSKLVKPLIIRS